MKHQYQYIAVLKGEIVFVAFLILLTACSPRFIGDSLISDGGFETNLPEDHGWEWVVHAGGNHYSPGKFEGKIDETEAHTGMRSLMIRGAEVGTTVPGKDPARAGYWNRSLDLEPERIYTLSFFYKTSSRTKGSVYVGENIEYNLESIQSWKKMEIISTFRGGIFIRVWGEGILWIDDVKLVESPVDVATPVIVGGRTLCLLKYQSKPLISKYEFENMEYLIFQKDYRGILPGDMPDTKELIESLTIFITPGEHEPITFAIFPLTNIGKVAVEFTDLVGKEGNEIDKRFLELRKVQVWIQRLGWMSELCRAVPELLLKETDVECTPGIPIQFWVTLHTPENTVPGEYEAQIRIWPEKASSRKILLHVKVLPFTLVNPPHSIAMWYDNYRIRKNKNKAKQDFQDMYVHGITSIVYAYPDFTLFKTPWQDVKTHSKIDFTEEDKWIEMYKEAGLKSPVVLELTRLAKQIFHLLDTVPILDADPAVALVDESNSPSGFAETYKTLVQQVKTYAEERGWPDVILYPVDEPTTATRRLPTAAYQYSLIKECWPEARILSTTYEIAASRFLQPWVDIMVVPLHRLLHDESQRLMYLGEASAQGDQLWTITWPGNDERNGFEKTRYASGFGFIKSGADGIMYWVYQHPGRYDRNGDWNDQIDLQDRTKHPCVAYPSPLDGGPVPTLQWEGIREGIDDLRYFLTLNEFIGELPDDLQRRYAERVESLLSDVPWIQESTQWIATEASKLRWEIAKMIIELQEIRKKQGSL